jgi:hypothetical protein
MKLPVVKCIAPQSPIWAGTKFGDELSLVYLEKALAQHFMIMILTENSALYLGESFSEQQSRRDG